MCVCVCARARPQADILHSELDVLSEHYSQKCLELSRTEQSSKSRETELGHKERQLEQLRRENQVYIHYLIGFCFKTSLCHFIDNMTAMDSVFSSFSNILTRKHKKLKH